MCQLQIIIRNQWPQNFNEISEHHSQSIRLYLLKDQQNND